MVQSGGQSTVPRGVTGRENEGLARLGQVEGKEGGTTPPRSGRVPGINQFDLQGNVFGAPQSLARAAVRSESLLVLGARLLRRLGLP
jgi:hypothetical protein